MTGQPGRRVRLLMPGTRTGLENGDEWHRPPERATRYGLFARLSDMAHGWADGRRGLPELPPMPDFAELMVVSPTAEAPPLADPEQLDAAAAPELRPGDQPALLPAPVTETVLQQPGIRQADEPGALASAGPAAPAADVGPAGPVSWLQTPQIKKLIAEAEEEFHEEKMACHRACVRWKTELQNLLAVRDDAARKMAAAKERLAQLQRPLTDQELGRRRLAEENATDRPASFVAKRRQAERDQQLRAAEREYQAAAARHSEATRQAQLRQELIRDRFAVGWAAVLRHNEFAHRRIATYQQQLVRRHRRGTELNLMLMSHPVGPRLPDWTEDPDFPAAGRGRWTSGPNPGEEGSNP